MKDKISHLNNKKIEDELNQTKINLAAEKAEKDQLIKNNEFITSQVKQKETTIKDLTKGIDSSKQKTKLHNEAKQEVKNQLNQNNKIVKKQENLLEK